MKYPVFKLSGNLLNGGKDCWFACQGKQGKCNWCGDDGWCCRKEWIGNGCDGVIGGTKHTCVLNPNNGIVLISGSETQASIS